MTLNEVLPRFEGVTRGADGQHYAKCPAHDDQHASLSISTGKDGRILFNCHAGCSWRDVAEAAGLEAKDLFPTSRENPKPRIVAVYDYCNAAGEMICQKVRREDKTFIWRQPDGRGGWTWSRKGIQPMLFNLPAIKDTDTVFVVEGEKDVLTLQACGLTAVCSPDGAGGKTKWRQEYSECLRGKAVIIIPDNDEQGRELARAAADSLQGIASSVKLIDLLKVNPQLKAHGDISDIVADIGGECAVEALRVVYADTPEYAPKATEKEQRKPSLVKVSDVPYEQPRWTIAPYFQRGKGTLVQADNGAGKTAFICAVAAHVSTGTPLLDIQVEAPGAVLILSVEDDLPVLRGRIETNGGDLDKCYFMTNAAGLTFNSPEVEAAVKEISARMVIFDPFQAFLGAGVDMHRSNETRPELAKLMEMAERNDCSIVILAHMSKGGVGGAAVNRALGSVDIPAAMRSIIQIGRNPEDEGECIAVHIKCSNAPKGRSLSYTIGNYGGITWNGYSPLTVDDLEAAKKRQERGIDYDQEPLVQVFRKLITDKPGGGFWPYAEVKEIGMKELGFPPFADTYDLKSRLSGSLAKELQQRDHIIVTSEHKQKGNRGIRIEPYIVQKGFQTGFGGDAG